MSLLKWRPDREVERAGALDLFESWQGAKPKERIEDDYKSYVSQGYKSNGVLFSVILARMALFSEIRFAIRSSADELDTQAPGLEILERPWPNGTTGELLARMEQDVSLAGNAYVYRAGTNLLERLRPDWVDIISTDRRTLAGYVYTPGGPQPGNEGVFLQPEEVVHWSPIPDPMGVFRGMSWITPVVTEIQSDAAMTRHKQMFFERAATPNMLIKLQQKLDPDSWQRLRDQLEQRHEGLMNAYRTMILEGGADATVVGKDMQAVNFDVVQAAGENRIATAAGVPGIVVGLKEGLQAATYSNYAQAMRRFADLWGRPQWRSVCSALEKFTEPPQGSSLWYDATKVAALRESESDAADIMLKKTEAIVNLVRAGYDGAMAAKVVETGEGLETLPHTGEVFFPGAQAYTQPGESPDKEPGDVAVTVPAHQPAPPPGQPVGAF